MDGNTNILLNNLLFWSKSNNTLEIAIELYELIKTKLNCGKILFDTNTEDANKSFLEKQFFSQNIGKISPK